MKHVYHLKLQTFTERVSPLLVQLFDFLDGSGYQCERLAEFLRKLSGRYIKLTIEEKVRPKSREALGFYFGCIIRATALEVKMLKYDPDNLARDYRDYRKKGFVCLKDLDNADKMLRMEFYNEEILTFGGIYKRIPKALADKDNPELRELINKIQLWRDEQGLPILDPERYKTERDSARMARGYVQKSYEYPDDKLTPTF